MPPEILTRPPGAMTARAALATRCRVATAGARTSQVTTLRSHAPLVLRPTRPKGPEPLVCRSREAARVSLAAGAAGPLGGDDFRLDVHVGAGSTLVLSEVSATVLLPGAHGGVSRMRISVTVDDGATLVWLPEPLIAAAGCDHRHEIDIVLAPDARLLLRDEVLLGRHREEPGRLVQDIRVRRDGRPLYHQRLVIGDGPWRSAAVLGARKCVGAVLVVDPLFTAAPVRPRPIGRDAAVMPLAGAGVVVTGVADDTLALRRQLDEGIRALGPPWGEGEAGHGHEAEEDDCD